MASSLRDDIQLARDHVQSLSSADRLVEFFAYLRYPEDARLEMTPEALQLPQKLKDVTRRIDRLTSVEAGALQVYLFELTSVTVAHTRALTRAFRNRAGNFLLVLTDDYERMDFVLLEREVPGLADGGPTPRGVTVRPRVLSVERRDPSRVALRVLRRFTFTEYDADDRRDPYAQWDKLKSAYTIAEWSEPLFNNRALFSDYYLNERLPEHPAWDAEARNQTFRAVRKIFAGARRRFAGEDAATIRTELIRPLLETLGFHVEVPSPSGEGAGPTESGREGQLPDFLLHADGGDGLAAFVLAYPWNRYLDGKDDRRDDERPEENPGAQVVTLLEAGVADWGIVTNGETWRLYSARAHSRATNTYEVNLEETLASPDPGQPFRYFYLFFRAEAFSAEERPVAGEVRELTFLDWLMEESHTYARELGERLKDRVFEEIFPHFAAGFIHSLGGPEAFQAVPEEEREAQLGRVYQGTLTFLYRLLFLLYAESRDLLPVREVRGYYRVSLRRLSQEIAEQAGALEDLVPPRLEEAYPLPRPGAVIPSATEGSPGESRLYKRLLDLFAVIDRGSPARNVPTYNGGLFITDPDEDDTGREAEAARFLEEAALPDRYLALGLDRLARDVDPKRGDLGFIDYKSLGVRQLGSIYEGLLEFNIEVANEKDVDRPSSADGHPPVVHLISDKGERKATGSYYTPDYIVKYIVRHTVGPVLDEKLKALGPRLHGAEQRFRKVVRRKVELEGVTPDEPMLLQSLAADVLHDLFDVKVLDPAMGSGHFLVEAVDYVTDRLVRFLDGFPFLGVFFEGMRRSILEEMERQKVTVDPGQLTDVTLLKRHVLKRCVYGVDLNPMAVELAKVSLWLDCFTLGAPLSFLDHHLRCGNSLIGAMAQEVEEEMGSPTAEGQMTFLTGPFAGLLRAAEIMRGVSAIADVTLEQVRESGHLFEAFDEAATPYKQLLDIHVARHFGVKRAEEFLTLYGAEAMETQPEELGKPYREVAERTRELYEKKRFFHWDLEFPEVFIDLEHAAWKEDGGFDAVVGNPPYATTGTLRATDMSVWRYYKSTYRSASTGKFDIYLPFLEKAWNLVQSSGRAGYILPNKWLRSDAGIPLRQILVEQRAVDEVTNFGAGQVFPGITTYTCVCMLAAEPKTSFRYTEAALPLSRSDLSWKEIEYETIGQRPWSVDASLWSKLASSEGFLALERIATIFVGTSTNADDVFVLENAEIRDDRISAFSPEEEEFVELEADICVPFLRGKEIARYRVADDSTVVVFPYERDTHSAHLLSSGLLSSQYPEAWAYLKRHEAKLKAREDGRWKGRDDWYCHAYPRNHGQIETRKLLTPDICQDGQWVLDSEGKYHCLNTVYGVSAPDREYSLEFLLALLNSKLFETFIRASSVDLRGGYYRVTKNFMRDFPVSRSRFVTPEGERERLMSTGIAAANEWVEPADRSPAGSVTSSELADSELGRWLEQCLSADPGRSDVVRHLLAYLAEQMIAMHEEKQERVEAFWDDLAAACESPGTFEDLHEHGKWEQSLWKDPACRPYVGRESRSTRHLDESLGWDEACYEAFAGMLEGKTSVTRPMIDVYRKHHPAYKALVERIKATDDLIDEIVYRLYGLTEEEIAVVEGRTTTSD